jgi:AraC family transcriptional activator of pyochelin receptor
MQPARSSPYNLSDMRNAEQVIEKQWLQSGDGYQARVSVTAFAGATVFSAESRQQKVVQFREKQPDPAVVMYFSLGGGSAAHTEEEEKRLLPDQHTICYSPGFDGYFTMNSPRVWGFGVNLEASFFQRLMQSDLECLKRFGDKIQRGARADISPQPLPVTTRQKAVIHDMQQCAYSGHMKRLYYESKITELFLLQAMQADSLMGRPSCRLRPADIEKLYAARDFVARHMLEPFTLGQVARVAGLNDFKLKKGFKELFGTTVFGYLQELKMDYARQLLTDRGCTVLEAAYALGYSEPHNFSHAFKKHFGHLPGRLKA